MKSKNLSVLIGAAFLMATSSIGPGFMTQTAAFTGALGADFAFVILISVIFAYIAQLNVWSVIAVSTMRGQDIANRVLPGLGYFIAFLVALGGLAFNIGNIGGAAIGLNVMSDMDYTLGAGLSGILGILVFTSKKTGSVLDKITQILGALMIALIAYVMVVSEPPVELAVQRMIMPEYADYLAIITLIGGTVGGYIMFSGGHRLIDAGVVGIENLKDVRHSAVMGMTVGTILRILLFLAVLGVVSRGFMLDPQDPAGSAFLQGAGMIGYKLFGIVFFCAALTSVIGAAYTSVSFLKTLIPFVNSHEKLITMAFIFVSTILFLFFGKPATLLILAGALNGLILPITLAVMLVATKNHSIVGNYKHPAILYYLGWIVVAATSYMGIVSLSAISQLW